ncbi:unnamed protein product, partial [Adineta steineri]
QNKGAYDLSFALQRNQALLSLNLSENQIGDQGGEDLCTALKLNETLTKLDLTSNTIKAEILSAEASAKSRLLGTVLKTLKVIYSGAPSFLIPRSF